MHYRGVLFIGNNCQKAAFQNLKWPNRSKTALEYLLINYFGRNKASQNMNLALVINLHIVQIAALSLKIITIMLTLWFPYACQLSSHLFVFFENNRYVFPRNLSYSLLSPPKCSKPFRRPCRYLFLNSNGIKYKTSNTKVMILEHGQCIWKGVCIWELAWPQLKRNSQILSGVNMDG